MLSEYDSRNCRNLPTFLRLRRKCLISALLLHNFAGEILHKFHTLSDMEKIINKRFAEQLKSCSQKITDMCKKEKESWLQIDNLEQECEQLIEQVDTKAQELVSVPIIFEEEF